MDRDTGSESDSSSSESPTANRTENTAFRFASSELGQFVPPPLKANPSVGSSSSEDDDGEEADRHTDISSTSSGESHADTTSAGKGLVTCSTSAPSAVDKSVLYGRSQALRSSLRSSSSFGGEGDSPSHESDDTEFESARAHKREASDASESSLPPPKRILQADDTGGGTAGTIGRVEYSDFAKRMMGHTAGRGLGREGQGIVEPVKEASRINRAGLGAARIAELEATDVQWEQEMYVEMVTSQVQRTC